uniref:Omega-amidase,chloroplastic-like n=1 Tax=Nicotiana sylvestris TaxID=4096 RepID=A0A1U7Y8I7_NICSY|nr:PREDICTED: omega-amidase,chloroplastic-like [Nicotiana sylvestris]
MVSSPAAKLWRYRRGSMRKMKVQRSGRPLNTPVQSAQSGVLPQRGMCGRTGFCADRGGGFADALVFVLSTLVTVRPQLTLCSPHRPRYCSLVAVRAVAVETQVKFKIGICQLKVIGDKNANISQARNFIHAAAEQGANLILLPEMWNCPYSADLFAEFAENLNDINSSPSSLMLSEVAYSLGVTIIGGSIPERDASSSRLYNTCCVFGPNGELKAKHRKIHLFDMGKPLPGDVHFKESDSFSAGEEPTVVKTGKQWLNLLSQS